MSELNSDEFNKSLPPELTHALFITARNLEELAFKCNFIVGRVYEDKETGEGYFISGIKQIVTRDIGRIDEYLVHAIILPEFEKIPVVKERME